MDIGGGWYGTPSHYAEYEAALGQALADPVRVFSAGAEEVWTREFERGFVVVSGIASSNFTLTALPRGLRRLPLSSNPSRIADQREAPAWQWIIDNSLHAATVATPLLSLPSARARVEPATSAAQESSQQIQQQMHWGGPRT